MCAAAVQAQERQQTNNDVLERQLSFRTLRADNARYDIDAGVQRAEYRIAPGAIAFTSPRSAADWFIEDARQEFGWEGSADLIEVDVRESRGGYHILYRQIFRELPVYGRYVKVNTSRNFQPTMVVSGYDPSIIRGDVDIDSRSVIDVDRAVAIASAYFDNSAVSLHESELVWFRDGGELFKAWRLVMSSDSLPGERELIVHAGDEQLLFVFDHSFRRRQHDDTADDRRAGPSSGSFNSRNSDLSSQRVDGTGQVFDPDPLSTSGSSYTPPFVDSGDADIPEVNSERQSVTLRDISQSEGMFVLEGPYVRIVGGGSLNYEPPREDSQHDFQYTRGSAHFEAVNAYYHVDKSQRYIQSLGFSNIANSAVSVNSRAFGSDNSVYSPSQNLIQFGLGGVDDGEDAGVLWHEYGHAVLESSSSGLGLTAEGQALHEGWSDYWAGSYLRNLADNGQTARTDWRNVFKWDSGDGQIWAGRTIESSGTYPGDMRCEDPNDSNGDGCNIHQDGIIWAATLMDIHDDLGRTVTDQLNLQSHSYLSAPVTFPDAAEALIQADIDLFDGLNTAILINHLGNRGFINESSYGPVITHDELPATEQLGGTIPISATVTAASAPVDSVMVRFGETSFDQTLLLTNTSGNVYEGNLPVPATPSTVFYYIEAVDDARQRSVLPPEAPENPFSFDVGPDNEAPEITHIPIESASVITWPPRVSATITDNLGIASVDVFFELRDASGTIVRQDTFALPVDGDSYSALFPVTIEEVEPGATIGYRITAVDASMGANQTVEPATGLYTFVVTNEGILASYDFEDPSAVFSPDGEWERGAPGFGLQIAHSGSNAWGTNLGGQYRASSGVSRLELPEFNLTSVGTAYLVFWHWYDMEHDGSVTPHELSGDAVVWDGGSIQVSVDGGSTWNVISPEDGYTSGIASNSGNPIGGQPAFGGYSFGWRRDIIELPTGTGVRVRFEFGTDNSNTANTRFFAGWFVDDVVITTELPDDSTSPQVTGEPDPITYVSTADAIDPIVLSLSDETGIARAELQVDLSKSSIAVTDVLLEMDSSDLATFFGRFDVNTEPVAGDRIAFAVEVEDFDGNTTLLNNNGASYIVEFRTFLNANLLSAPVATGLWRTDGPNWIADGSGLKVERSALIVDPVTLPDNTDIIRAELVHRYNLLTGAGGNVKITADDGATWQVLEPVGGYNGNLIADSHPMAGEPVFTGTLAGLTQERFDLSAFGGQHVRLKLDLGASRPLDFSEHWEVVRLEIAATTIDDDAIVPLENTLGTNFPDPFSGLTNIDYSVAEAGIVKISVYDILGRRVQVPIFSEHEPGNYTLQVHSDGLASGMYFIVMEAGNTVKSEPVTVIH